VRQNHHGDGRGARSSSCVRQAPPTSGAPPTSPSTPPTASSLKS
jgi:hypothetical protein